MVDYAEAERCREVYRQMLRAMIDKDIAALDSLLDETFVLVHMTGMRQDKRAFIGAVAGGTLNYYSCRHDGIDVDVRGDAATLVGRSRVTAAVFGGGAHTWRLRQALRLARRDGNWHVVLSEASTY